MFTGIVEEMGRLVAAAREGATTRLTFAAPSLLKGVEVGDSIAVNGCCLTVVGRDRTSFSADAIDETLARTNLGALSPGEAVNLERAVAIGERLGGHLVQGHVDGVGVVVTPAPHLRVEVPAALSRYVVEKGSVAIDGCSLTVVDVEGARVRVELVPHTSAVTILGAKAAGATVNVEVDVVARYVEALMRAGASSPYGPTASA